jgi:hypothetical protein
MMNKFQNPVKGSRAPHNIRFAGFPVEPVEPRKRGLRSNLIHIPANGPTGLTGNLFQREHFNSRGNEAIEPYTAPGYHF